MSTLKSTERVVKLINILQSGRKDLSTTELAKMFGVSRRTIFRDLSKLSEMEIPVTYDPFVGYGMMKGYSIPPMMFTTRELATLMVGLNFAKTQIDQGLSEDAEVIASKINQVLPKDLKEFMGSLMDKMVVDPFLFYGFEKRKGGSWYEISIAISQKKRIIFDYEDLSGNKTKRKLDPYVLVYYKDQWNVIGFSHERNEARNFILDRITNIDILNETLLDRKGVDVEGLIFRNDEGKTTVMVEVDSTADRRFKANLPTKIIRTERVSPNLFRYTFRFDNLEFLTDWLLQFSDKVRVVEPEELIDRRRELLERLINGFKG